MRARRETVSVDASPPFLEITPPVWAARGLATILLALFMVGTLAAFLARVPESVTAPFVLIPLRGGDPVRALRSGVVTEVQVVEAQAIVRDQAMYRIASTAVGDRAAEGRALDAQIASLQERIAARRDRDASQRRADEAEAAAANDHLESLTRTVPLKTQRLATMREIAVRQQRSFERGLVSWIDVGRAQADCDNLALELEREKADQAEAQRSLTRLREQAEARRAESREAERALVEDLDRARIRRSALERDAAHQGNELVVASPCAGTVLKLLVRNQGAVVQEGDVLAETSCGADGVQAELTIPQEGAAAIRSGQPVRLLYSTFPYQRYGARSGTIRWISPAGQGSGLRALATIDEDSVIVNGSRRALVPGMIGRARVVVGRRTLVSYAFEPIRQLRENLTGR
jgi:multidrug efflux pump subunit AcrA (membrane-fusion protein)